MAAASSAADAEHWESLPGWTPVYLGLGRFRTGLVVRLVLVVLGPLAIALALAHGPPPFLTATLVLAPVLAAMTSVLMVSGLALYARPPAQLRAEAVTRDAKRAFTGLLVIDLAHVGVAAFVTLGSAGMSIDALLTLQLVGELWALVCLGVFIRSLVRIADYVGAMPALGRLRHLWIALAVLAPALLVVRLAGPWLGDVGFGVRLVASSLVLGGAVLVLAGVSQVVASLRENLFLTTSEFAAVSVTGERRAVDS